MLIPYRQTPDYIRAAMVAKSQRKRMQHRAATLDNVPARTVTIRTRKTGG